MTTTVNNQSQPKVWMNGHYVPAQKDTNGKWYVEVDGKRVEVDPNDLFGVNSNITEWPEHFVNYYDNKFTESQENISTLKKMGSQIREKIDKLSADFNSYLASLGVKSFNEIENKQDRTYAEKTYCSNLSNLNREKTRNSNQYFSECLTAFDYALQKGNWQNQLNLAQHVQDNLYA